MSTKHKEKREWHGCKDARGHLFIEGKCQVAGCGMDLNLDHESKIQAQRRLDKLEAKESK